MAVLAEDAMQASAYSATAVVQVPSSLVPGSIKPGSIGKPPGIPGVLEQHTSAEPADLMHHACSVLLVNFLSAADNDIMMQMPAIWSQNAHGTSEPR